MVVVGHVFGGLGQGLLHGAAIGLDADPVDIVALDGLAHLRRGQAAGEQGYGQHGRAGDVAGPFVGVQGIGLAVPADTAPHPDLTSAELFARFAHSTWIGNSRNPAEEALLRVLSSMAGFEPRVDHLVDSLDLVEELILARQGVGLLPVTRQRREGLTIIPLRDPKASVRTYVLTRQGQAAWPPLALMLDKLTRQNQ